MALSRDKQIILGVVVLAALGGLAYRQTKVDEKKGTALATTVTIPSVGGSDDLDKFTITNGDKPEVTLEKKGDKWFVTKPLEAIANQQHVKAMMDNLKDIKAKEIVAQAATDDLKKSYELDSSKVVHVVGWKGADKKVDDLFGKTGGRGEMMMTGDNPGIFAASGYSSYNYTHDVKGWRETEIFKFDDANVAQITIDNKNGAFSFTKGDKWAGTFKGKPIDKMDEEKVKDLLRAYHMLQADDFGDGKPVAETGLDAPESTVTFTLKDGAGKNTLKVGKVQTGSSHYAQKDGSDTIYVIGTFASDFATANEAKFQKTGDGGAPAAPHGGMGGMGMPGMGGMGGHMGGPPD